VKLIVRTEGKHDMSISEVVSALEKAGIKGHDATVLISILMKGEITAGNIASATGINRVQVYRSIAELESKGLIHAVIGRPKRYTACPADKLLRRLIEEKRLEFETAADTLLRFVDSLPEQPETAEASAKLQIIRSRTQIYREIADVISRAEDEVLVFTTTKGINRSYQAGINEVLLRSMQRGVKCRMITDISVRNKNIMTSVSRFVPLRHLERQRARFIISDRKSILAFLIQDEDSLSGNAETALWTTSTDFVRAHIEFFEHAWKIAVPSERRFAQLNAEEKKALGNDRKN
jgi:sugar-specific transcriptional regulator TrmB